tara:strand:+ start:43004 stop:43180 length:177 start_codon:yes stop_codon:yes gene_type:complete
VFRKIDFRMNYSQNEYFIPSVIYKLWVTILKLRQTGPKKSNCDSLSRFVILKYSLFFA